MGNNENIFGFNDIMQHIFDFHPVISITLSGGRVCLAAPVYEDSVTPIAEKKSLLFAMSLSTVKNFMDIQASLVENKDFCIVEVEFLDVRYQAGAVETLKPLGRLREGQRLDWGVTLDAAFFRVSKDAIELATKRDDRVFTSKMNANDLYKAVEKAMTLPFLRKPSIENNKTLPPLGERKSKIKPPVR